MVTASEFDYATAAELTAAMDAGEVSAVELAEAVIERIERLDPAINAVPVRDLDRALEAARGADAARTHGERRPLLGVPVTVKESFNVAGLPTTWGIPPFKDFTPQSDAVAVSRLRSAGAVILGKTNVPVALGDLQTYNPIYGTTNNPWDLSRTPGGSSGGSAAALAAGFGAVSIGSDIAGSLRVPAHFSGVYAHKPSFGLLPSRGHTAPPAAPVVYDRDLTVIGPMARGASDLMMLLELLAEPDLHGIGIAHQLALRPPRHDRLADYRVLIVETHPAIETSAAVRKAIDAVVSVLSSAGAAVHRHSELLPDQLDAARIYMRLLLASVAAGHPPKAYSAAQAAAAAADPDDHSLAAERARGGGLSYRDWITTDSARARLREQWRQLFEQFDIVLCPAAPTTAFPHDQSADQWTRKILIDGQKYDYADQLVWAGIATAPGLPATVAPVGLSDDGLPIGLQLIGPLFEDRTPIRFAELLEAEVGGFRAPSRT
jgi:amidase